MEQMAVSTPKRLFTQVLTAQVSFPPADSFIAASDTPNNIVHRQSRYPESGAGSPEQENQITSDMLRFCLPVSDPFHRSSSASPPSAFSPNSPTPPSFSSSWTNLHPAKDEAGGGSRYVVHDVVLTDEKGDKRYGTCLAVRGLALVETTLAEKLQKAGGSGGGNNSPKGFEGGGGTGLPQLFTGLSQLSLNFSGSRESLEASSHNLQENHFVQSVAQQRDALTACFVLLSPFPAFSVARHCLHELMLILEEEQAKPTGEAERFIWWIMNNVIVPPNGGVGASFTLERSQITIPFGPFVQPRVPFLEISLLPVFQHLGLGNIITIVSQLILEQPVVFFSTSYPLLTTFTEAFISLIYPFQWRHVYLPVVPSPLAELLEAPGVYIYGALAKDVEERWNDIQPDTLKVDLDRDVVAGGCDLRFQLPNSPELLENLRALFYPTSRGRKHGFLEQPRTFQKPSLGGEVLERTGSFSSVLFQEKVDPELERKLNGEIRLTFMMYLYDNLLRDFFSFQVPGNQQDFNTVDFISKFPSKDRKFLEQFTSSTIFNTFLECHESVETTDDFDFFASTLVFPREAHDLSTHIINYGAAGTFDPKTVPNFEPLKRLPEAHNSRIFRTDYFDLLKHRYKEPMSNTLKTLEKAGAAVKTNPAHHKIVRWMEAVTLYEAGNLDAALKIYSEILTKNFVIPEVNLILEKAGSEKRLEISKNPKTPANIVALIHGRDGAKPPPLTRLSSQISERESSTMDDWVSINPLSGAAQFRPNDRLILNEMDPTVPPLADLSSNPLLLATEALKLIRSFYSLLAEGNDEGEMIFKERRFEDIVKMPVFKKFTNMASQLAAVDISKLDETNRLCFFLNIRTCLALHAFAEHGFPSSLFRRVNFLFQKVVYDIGGNLYSISEISYGILRAPMSLPDVFGVSVLTISKMNQSDPRYRYRNHKPENLLNFVMFEGNASFPYAIVFEPTDFHAQLKREAHDYCERNIKIDPRKSTNITIPRALVWHMADFGKTEKDILLYIFDKLPETTVAKHLAKLGQKPQAPIIRGISVKVADYSWNFSITIPRKENEDDD